MIRVNNEDFTPLTLTYPITEMAGAKEE